MNYELFQKITQGWSEFHKVKFLMEGPNWAIIFESLVREHWNESDDYITVYEIALFANDHGIVEQTNLEVIE